jgi:hypothetical protein
VGEMIFGWRATHFLRLEAVLGQHRAVPVLLVDGGAGECELDRVPLLGLLG